MTLFWIAKSVGGAQSYFLQEASRLNA